jgi:hypothetical protein
VDNHVTRWSRTPKPEWYDESGGFTWDQLFGVFKNTEPGAEDHIDNVEGAQAIYLFAVPEAGIYQDQLKPSETFEIGRSYQLTAGLLGGGGMTNGVTLEMSLYFVDGSGNRVTVASTNVTYDTTRFSTRNHLVDIQLDVPPVRAGDAWAGQPIGLRFLSRVDPTLVGGYWDIDNVRLLRSIHVPNASFESPEVEFVDNHPHFWQKTPKPAWYDESGGFTWDQLFGVFKNTAPGADDHIDNCDGAQAFYLFAVPTVGVFQDQLSTNAAGASAIPPLDVRFEPGKSYALSMGVLGGGGGMTNGASLSVALYYRNDSGNPVVVAETNIIHDPATFPTHTHFKTYEVRTSKVRMEDPWAGKNLGIQVVSTVDPNLAGGYWDIDNVQVQEIPEIGLLDPYITDSEIAFTLQSEAGLRLEVLAADEATGLNASWSTLSSVTNLTGLVSIADVRTNAARRFYQVKQVP